jgi:hemerythrin-like domain-containing protein
MADQSVTAIDLLMDQHREVEDLFAQLEKADDPEEKSQICAALCDKLAIHAKIEEKTFYPGIMRDQTEDALHEAVEEHLQVKRLIADLLHIDPSDDRFEAAASVLKEDVSHHVKEEETELFPKVKKIVARENLIAMAQEMMATVVELEGKSPRNNVPSETKEPASLD